MSWRDVRDTLLLKGPFLAPILMGWALALIIFLAHHHRPYMHFHQEDVFGTMIETVRPVRTEEDWPTLAEFLFEVYDWCNDHLSAIEAALSRPAPKPQSN